MTSIDSYLNVRFFGAYGPYEPSRKITTKWMRAVMNGHREFTIRGNGENLIDFMHVDDAVDGFLRLTSSAGQNGPTRMFRGTWSKYVRLVSSPWRTAPMPPIARRVCGCGECDPGMPPECQPPG